MGKASGKVRFNLINRYHSEITLHPSSDMQTRFAETVSFLVALCQPETAVDAVG